MKKKMNREMPEMDTQTEPYVPLELHWGEVYLQ